MRGVSKGIEAVLVALIVICGLGLLSIGVRSTDMVFDLPLTEDGYYVMTIARNVARGVGFSVDGTTLTNGFHPLWGVLSSLAFLVGAGSDELSMRLVLVASATTTVVSAVLWARLFSNLFGTDNRLYRLCFVLIYLTSFQLLAQHFNGLETGLLLALLGAIGFYWSSSEPSLGRNAILGLLLGLLVLVRIDTGLFAVVVALEALWRGRRKPGRTLAEVFVMGAMATLIAGPWFAYNIILTGKLMPVSGLALAIEMATPQPLARSITALSAIVRNGVLNILGEISRTTDLIVLLAAGGLTFVLLRSEGPHPWQAQAGERARRSLVYIGMITVYLMGVIVFYAIDSNAVFFYQRYFILVSVLAAGVFAFLLWRVAISAASWVVVPVAVVLVGLTLVTILGWHGVPLGERLNRLQAERNGPCLEQVEIARSVRLPGEIVAGIQSGTLAFFVEGAINLDGRVNFAAYKARLAGKLMDYVLAQRIGLLVDYDVYLDADRFNYFTPPDDPKRYFRQVAPPGKARPYEWVALRRQPEQAR
jgi:hypothetical protein